MAAARRAAEIACCKEVRREDAEPADRINVRRHTAVKGSVVAVECLFGMRVRWGEPPRVWVPPPVFSTLRRRTR